VEFKLKIKLGNAAMQTGSDVASALRKAASAVEIDDELAGRGGIIRDLNGNTVGDWSVSGGGRKRSSRGDVRGKRRSRR